MDADDWFDRGWDPPEGVLRPRARRQKDTPPGTWTTADGQTIAFQDMAHSHLLNTIAWVERQFRQLQDTFNESALDIDLLYPSHAGLVAEARRRRLIPRGKKGMVTA